MITITYPDYMDALVDHVQSFQEMTNVVASGRIVSEIRGGADMTNHNHLVFSKSGGPTSLPLHGTISPRIDTLAFGTTHYESMRIIRVLRSILTPVGDTRFVSNGVIFDSIWAENEPMQLETPQNWPYVLNVFGMIVLREPLPVIVEEPNE